MNRRRKNLIAILGVLGTTLITIGLTYAFFTYTKEGTTENSIKSGSITFLYDEQYQQGNSIGITDALPMSDTDGKAQLDAFNFRIVSKTGSSTIIPYTITLRQKEGTDDIGDKIKVYLAETTAYDAAVNTEVEVVTSLFSSLEDTTKNGYSEKILYEATVPERSSNYNQNYRLKMWLDESTDFSDGTYSNKTFTVTVNVYAEGENYNPTLAEMVIDNNTLINAQPTLTTSSNNTSDASGLYKMSVTNGFGGENGDTYYFRGNVNNNYVSFAGKTWRIVRINEDGTVRLALNERMDSNTYAFNTSNVGADKVYYSNSTIKTPINAWYDSNIGNNSLYSDKIAAGSYFCEAAKVKGYQPWVIANESMTYYDGYTPNLACATDANGHGVLDNTYKIGLLTYDEMVLAGYYFKATNNSYYLTSPYSAWTMSPDGVDIDGTNRASVWVIANDGSVPNTYVDQRYALYPVINLKADVTATGTGTQADPYVVQ